MINTTKQDPIIGIYKITSPSGRIYIGQSKDVNYRWYKSYKVLSKVKGQPKIYNSLKKYGWEAHKFEILEECLVERLHEREIWWKEQILEEVGWGGVLFCKIKDPQTKIPSGYTLEVREKISKALKGRILSEDTKNKISISNSNKKRTKEHICKLNETRKISIYQIDIKTNEIINEFSSMKEAGRFLGNNANGITEVIKGRSKTAYGFKWKVK